MNYGKGTKSKSQLKLKYPTRQYLSPLLGRNEKSWNLSLNTFHHKSLIKSSIKRLRKDERKFSHSPLRLWIYLGKFTKQVLKSSITTWRDIHPPSLPMISTAWFSMGGLSWGRSSRWKRRRSMHWIYSG